MNDKPFTIVETDESRRTGLGAIVEGLDTQGKLSGETAAALRAAALKYPVLVIRSPELDPGRLADFASTFGELQPHTAERYRHPERPELSYISNVDREGKIDDYAQTKRATGWHSDGSFLRQPYSFTMLYGVEVPSKGGATMFANCTLAYDRLPDDIRSEIADVQAVHAIGSGPDGAGSPSRNKRFEQPDLYPDIIRPVVSVHPETGKRALFINPMHTSHLVMADKARADELYSYLIEFVTQPEFVYAHQWRANDIVIWDQRCTLHRAGGGVDPSERRIMLRALVKGTELVAAA